MGQYFKLLVIIPLVLSIGITTSLSFAEIDSPRKQMANGVSAEDVVCKSGLVLIKRNSGTAACVKPSTATKLENAGWGTIIKENAMIETEDKQPLEDQKEEFNFGKARMEILLSIDEIKNVNGFEIELDKSRSSLQTEESQFSIYKLIHNIDGWVGDLTFYYGKPDTFHPSSFENTFQVKFFMSNEQGIAQTSSWRPFLKAVLSPLVPEWSSINSEQIPSQWIEDVLNNVSADNEGNKIGELKSSSKEILFSYNDQKIGYVELIINEKIIE